MKLINSEIKRYYWQDFSLQRIVVMPLLIMAIVLLIVLATVGPDGILGFFKLNSPSKVDDLASIIPKLEYFYSRAFSIIVLYWGGYCAANAVIEEVSEKTWDNQRLASVSAWQLTTGKLFGSTLYTWYGGAILLVLYAITMLLSITVLAQNSIANIFFNLLLMISTCVFCHAIALLASMQSLRSEKSYSKLNVIISLIVGLFAAYFFRLFGELALAIYTDHHLLSTFDWLKGSISWYGADYSIQGFVFASLSVFLLWSIIGVNRSMRSALKFSSKPWVWAAFVLYLMTYIAGFLPEDTSQVEMYLAKIDMAIFPVFSRLGLAFIIAILSTYFVFFSDNLLLTRYRALYQHWQHQAWSKFSETIPMWIVSLLLSLAVATLLLLQTKGHFFFFMLAVFLFLARDACLLHYFTFAPNNRRAIMATLFYLFVLYFLLPGIFYIAVGSSAMSFFYPSSVDSALTVLPVLFELCLLGLLLRSRYKSLDI